MILKGVAQTNVTSQEDRTYHKSFEIQHDNDFLLSTDRYYTTGSFIGLTFLAPKKNDSAYRKQLRLAIEQEIYTPTDLLETDPQKFDRTYAGYLGLSAQLTFARHQHIWNMKLAFGFTGPLSGAQFFQSAFHQSAAQDSRIATWKPQIENNLLTNLYASYIREWPIPITSLDVYAAVEPEIAVGTRDIYGQNDLIIYIGKRNKLEESAAYKQIGNFKNELFFSAKASYRYVIHNTLLEGVNFWTKTTDFTKEPFPHLFMYGFEGVYRLRRNTFTIGYTHSSSETSGAENHAFTSFSFIRNF